MKNARGQGIIEYLILVVVIAVGAISIIKAIHGRMDTKLHHVENEIQNLEDGH
jgi:Flp pilus assembly pilin Flp